MEFVLGGGFVAHGSARLVADGSVFDLSKAREYVVVVLGEDFGLCLIALCVEVEFAHVGVRKVVWDGEFVGFISGVESLKRDGLLPASAFGVEGYRFCVQFGVMAFEVVVVFVQEGGQLLVLWVAEELARDDDGVSWWIIEFALGWGDDDGDGRRVVPFGDEESCLFEELADGFLFFLCHVLEFVRDVADGVWGLEDGQQVLLFALEDDGVPSYARGGVCGARRPGERSFVGDGLVGDGVKVLDEAVELCVEGFPFLGVLSVGGGEFVRGFGCGWFAR